MYYTVEYTKTFLYFGWLHFTALGSNVPVHVSCKQVNNWTQYFYVFICLFLKIIFQLPPPESHNGPLRGFKIAYRLAGVAASTFIIRKIENPAATQGNIDGLVQWTAYQIKVLAYNDAGEGTYSNPITVTTSEGGKSWRQNFHCQTKRWKGFSKFCIFLYVFKIFSPYIIIAFFHQERDFLSPIILIITSFLNYPSVKCEFFEEVTMYNSSLWNFIAH